MLAVTAKTQPMDSHGLAPAPSAPPKPILSDDGIFASLIDLDVEEVPPPLMLLHWQDQKL